MIIGIAVILLSISVVCSLTCNAMLEKRVSSLDGRIARLEDMLFNRWLERRLEELKNYSFTEELENDGQ